MDYLLRTIEEGVVSFETRADPDDLALQWVALNCGIANLPIEAGKYRLSASHRWSKSVTPDGVLREMEYSLKPDWWNLDSFWDSFTPVDPPDVYKGIWYNDFSAAAPTRFLAGDYYLLESALQEYKDSQADIWSVILAIFDSSRHPKGGPTPITFDFSRKLNGPFRSKDDLQRLVVVAKRLVRLQLAYIYWWISCWDDWELTLGPRKVEIVKRLDLTSYRKRGVILDCQRDWISINLPFLLQEGVPVYYSYGPRERNDDRFAFLDPEAMRAYEEELALQPQEVRGDDVTISHSFFLNHRFRFSRIYDRFAQPSLLRYVGTSNPRAQFNSKWSFYIIDFWGWRRRLIQWMLLVNLYARLYHYSEEVDNEGNHVIIFWRWRRRVMEVTSDDEHLSQLEHTIFQIRELFKGQHAPRPGQAFDEETGVGTRRFHKGYNHLVKAAPLIEQDVARFKELYQSHDIAPENILLTPRSDEIVSFTSDPPMAVDETDIVRGEVPVGEPANVVGASASAETPAVMITVDIDSESNSPSSSSSSKSSAGEPGNPPAGSSLPSPAASSTPSLISRLTSPPPPPSPFITLKGSHRHQPYPKGAPRTTASIDESSSIDSDRPGLTLGPWRAARPPRDYSEVASQMQRPSDVSNFYDLKEALRRLWVQEFGEAARKLTYAGHVWRVDRQLYKWKEEWLQKGVLILELREQVLLRYWCNVSPNVKSIEDLLYLAVERGIQFKIGIREEDRSSFRKPEEKITGLDRDSKKQYSQDYSVPPLTWKTGPAFRDDYIGHVVDVCRHPHSGCFISMGGPVAYVAREFGGYKVIRRLFKGPSIQISMHNGGGSDTDDRDARYLHYDAPSNSEIDFLLGRIPGAGPGQDLSLYPSHEILEKGCDNWTGEWTGALEAVFDKITATLRAGAPILRTRKQWIKFLRPPTRVDKDAKVTEQDWSDTRDMLYDAFGTDWNKRALEEINVPEAFNPTEDLEEMLTAEHDRRRYSGRGEGV